MVMKYFFYILGIILSSLSFWFFFDLRPKDVNTFDFWLLGLDFLLGLLCIRKGDKLDRRELRSNYYKELI